MIQASSFKFRPQQLCLLFIMLVCVALSHKSAFAGTPTFSMSFSPSSIAPNGVSTLTYLIDNTANDTAVTNVSFANTLPSGVTLASPVNASDTCNGQVSATAGGGTITYSLDRFGIGESCEISVDVTSSAAASYSNTTGDLTSSGGNSGTANATLTVDSSLIAFSIALSPNTISPGALSTLTYTFDNTMNSENMDGLSIDSVLPTGVEVSGQPNPTTDCTIYESGTYFGVVAEPGSDSISIGYLDVPAGTSCSVNVDVTSTTISSHTIESGDLSNSTYFSYSGGRFYNSITNLGLNSTALLTVESSILNLIVPHSVSPGSLVTLTFDLMNSNRDQEITDLTFTNDLNAALSGLTASSLPSDGFCGADSSISGSSDLTISGISLDSGSNCSFNVTLMIPSSAAAGSYTNTTSTVSYNLGGTPTTSTAVTSALNVYNAPMVSMAFLDDSVGLGEDVTLRFTVSNTDSSNSLSSGSLQLTVNGSISGTTIKTLPSADACGSGSSFSSSLSSDVLNFVMSDGALIAGGSCTFDLVLTLPDTGALGDFTFTTEQVSGTVNSQSLAGNTATDILSVIGAPALSFSLSSNVALPGDSITASFALNYNENAQADATGVSFTVDLDGVLSGLASTSSALSDVCGTSSSISGSLMLTFTDGTLSPGDSCSFSVNLQIPENADSGSVTLATSLINATVSSSSVSSVAVSQDLLISGLSGTKVFMPSAVLPGTTAVLRYTLSNSANAAEATNIAFTDNLSSVVSSLTATSLPSAPCGSSSTISGTTFLSFSGGELQPGDSCTFDVELSVPSGAAIGSYVSNSSSISATVNSSSVTANSMNTSLIVEELTVNITTTASNPTSASLIPVSVYFSRDVVNFVSSDLVLSNGSVSSFTGSGSSYLAEVTPASDGVVTIDLPANVVDDAVESSVKNPAATQLSVTYESTPAIADPSIAISSPSDSLAATGPITYTVTYTDVTLVNLTTSAITLNKTGTADAVVAVTDGDTETPTVTLSSLTGDGTLGFSIAESTARNSTKTAGSAGPASTFTVDNTQPEVVITSSLASNTFNDNSFTATFTFNESVSGFAIDDIAAVNATVSNFQQLSAALYTATITPQADGLVTLNVSAGKAQDSVGNSNLGASQYQATYDGTPPTVDITSSLTGTSSNSAFTATFTFSEDVTGFSVSDIFATNATIDTFSASSGSVYTVVVTPVSEGAVILNVSANVAQDSSGNNNAAAPEFEITYDTSSPSVAISSNVSGGVTNGAFTATFTFSEAVDNFTASDVLTTNAVLGAVSATSASVYTATVTPVAEGVIILDIPANIAQDSAGNNNTAATQYSTTYDASAPTVVISSSVTGSNTNSAFTATFTFSEAVTGFAVTDINAANASLSNFASSSPTVYTATVTPGADGTVTVDVPANIAQDSAGNNNTAATQYSTTYDASAPTVVISSSVTGSNTNSAFTATFTFSEAVTGFAVTDINAANASLSNFASSSPTVYTATVTPGADGTVTVDVPANIAQDSAGNNNTAATQYSTTYDASAPTVVISSSVTGSNTNSAFTATFTFSEAVTGFAVTDINAANASLSNFASSSTTVYTATVTPGADGTVTVDVPANIAQDSAGNNNTAATQYSTTYDASAPTVAISSSVTGTTTNSAFTATFTFSEAVTGFAVTDINAANASLSNFASSSTTVYTATVTPSADGTVTVNVPANIAQDSASNNNTAATQYSTTYDASAPTVVISSSVTSSTTNTAFTATFTFSEAVTGFAVSDVSVSNAILSNFASSSTSVYTATITPSADGTVTVDVPANIAQDSASNNNTAATQYSTTYDASAPTVVISSSVTGSTTNTAFTATFTFSEAVTGFAVSDINAANASLSNFASSSTTVYTATVTPSADGTVTVNVPANIAQDSAGNNNTAATQYSTTYDASAPTVVISSSVTGSTTNGAFTATFTFSEAVTGFAVTDVSASNANLSNFNAVSTSVYSATVTPSADGTVTVNVPANIAQDSAGNNNTAATQYSTTYDASAPTVAITSSGTGTTTNGAFTVTFTFSEAVTGFAVTDISASNANVSNFVSSSSTVYTATITPSADGTVTVNVPANIAQDSAGNNNTAATQYSTTYDASAPAVAITSSVGSATNGAFTATFTFSEAVTGFAISDVSASNAILSNFASSSSTVYTATITPSADGTVTVNIPANIAQDSAGNNNTAATQYSTTYDASAPTVVISSSVTGSTTNTAFTATFTFSEAVTGFAVTDINAANASLSNFASSSTTVYTATVTPSADGTVTVNVPANIAQDSAGNNNTAATQYSTTYDASAPTVTITSSVTGTSANGAFTATFTFSEAVTGFAVTDINAANASLSNFASSSTTVYTATVTPSADGTVTVNVPANIAQDSAGNNNTAATQYSTTYDGSAPSVVIASDITGTITSGAFTATFTFSEAVTGFAVSDINAGNASVSNFASSSSTVYTATVTPTVDGAVTVDVPANVAQDESGNNNTAATQYSITYDASAPTVVISSNVTGASTNGAFTATFTFSEEVTGFDISDISAGNASVSDFVSISALAYTATVTPIDNGVVTLDVAAEAAQDSSGNNNSAAQQYSVTYDVSGPTVSITLDITDAITNDAFTATFTFSEEVTDFEASDVNAGNASVSNFVSSSSTVYTATVTPSADGVVTIDVPANVAQDTVGNGNTSATRVTITYDGTLPQLVSSTPANNDVDVDNARLQVTLTFSEEIKLLGGNIVLVRLVDNEVIETLSLLGDSVTSELTTITAIFASSLTENELYGIVVNAGSISDVAGNEWLGLDENALTFTAGNEPPGINDDSAVVDEDGEVTIAVLENDEDQSGQLDITSVVIELPPLNGTATVDTETGAITYAPNLNHNGVDSFTYVVSDTQGSASPPATVSITINPINDVPLAADDTVTTDEEQSLVIAILDNDSDVDEQSNLEPNNIEPSTVTIVDNVDSGELVIVDEGAVGNDNELTVGQVIYTPDVNFAGTDTFTYTVNDSTGAVSTVATVTINVGAVNDSPTANDDVANTNEDEAVVINVTNNDVDSEDELDVFSVTIEGQGTLGTATVNSNTGEVTYTPNADKFGSDSFTYSVQDEQGLQSNIATVTVIITSVNDAPIAESDVYEINTRAPSSLNVLANDRDPDSVYEPNNTLDVTSVNIVSAPELGTVNVDNVTGLIIYTPNEDTTVATDTLSYQVLDTLGEVSNTATVQITLQLQSSELVANDDNASLLEDASVTIDVLANDGDTTRTLDVTSVAITQSANHGITQVNSNGFVTYTPNANYFGEDSFAYTVNDTDGDLSNEATVIISVASVNDAPTISGSPAVSVIAGNNYQFTPSASDIDSSTLTFSIQNKPFWSVFNTSTGVLSGIANESDAGVYSNILISVTDDAGASVALSAFTIDVISTTSLTPTAIDLDVSASEDELVSFTVQATDPNNLPLTYALVQSPQSGTLTGTLPFVAYTPNENFFGQDSFTFTASNGDYISEPANVTIQVASVNDAPVAVDDQASVVEGQEVVINVLDNDSDIDSDTLTVTSASSNQGVVTLNDNLLSYQAADSFTGTVIVDYSISDNDGLSASAQVVVTVRADENKETNILLDVPEDVEVNATGLITRVTLGQATATDDLDNAVSVTLQTPPFFSPGKHSVTWQAEAGDDVQQGSQLVTVHPIITVEKSQRVQEGGRATIDVYLNGFAPEYPLSIPYSVSGSSDTDDHDLTDGIVVIESGKYGSITLDVADDDRDEGEETLIVTLDPTLNVGNAEHTLTIVEGGVAPALQLTAIQNDTSVTTIYQQAGTVDVQLSLENKESSDIQFIDWSDSANALTAINTATIDTMFSFSPESLGAGVYHIRASVTDTDGLVGFADITLRLSVELPTLTSADTDGDGIPDNIEGYGDEDGDGIADYLDATDECNVQPVNLDSEASFYIEGEVGACFRLGDIAAGTSGSVNVDQSVLPSDTDMTSTGAVVDFVISGLNEIGQTYRVVIPQQNVIPNDAVYRKYSSELESWKNFEITGSSNTIHSTEGEQGICPPPGDDLWVEGINEGHWCIQLTLSDGGPNDDDGIANGIIVDPSGLAVTANQNQLPVASDDQLAYTTGSTEVLDVLSNDTDPDNDVLTLVSVNAYLGSTEISNNELIYTPPNTFSGTDTIVYAISDGNGGTDSALVLVSVDVNNAPQAFDDTAETFSQTAITIDVLANDSDADGDVLMLIYADVDDGDVEIVDSKLLYTPPTEFIGTATITYQVEDSRGSIAEASVSVNVIEAVNEAPIAQDDSARTSNQASITVDVLDNDSDADGDELTLVNVTSTVGQAVIQNNKIVYTPESDFVGLVNVTYFVTDGETEVSATLTIQVFQQVKSEGGSVSAFFILLMLLTLIYRLNVRLGASNTNNSIEIKSRIIR